MIANHMGMDTIGSIATMSYSFVVHCNIIDAVMEDDGDQWWIQEWSFSRAAAGRAFFTSKTWSPSGVHVATSSQDGLCSAGRETSTKSAQQVKL